MCFVEGDYVMRQGTKPDGMFFVQTGTVEIVKNKDGFETRVTTLSDGSFFGESALISDSGRATASVRAITNVNGLYLSKRNYTHLTANYPAFKKYLETVANLREKARQDAAGQETGDAARHDGNSHAGGVEGTEDAQGDRRDAPRPRKPLSDPPDRRTHFDREEASEGRHVDH
jgi:signal-transduction protein with cAMP-binding, CBS, and nucleotidyltransferase domain